MRRLGSTTANIISAKLLAGLLSKGTPSNMWSRSMCCSPFNLLTSVIHPSCPPTLAFLSSSSSLVGQMLVGQSGRKYARTKELKSDTSIYQRSVYVAE